MRIFVLGATGRLGQATIARARAVGHDVTAFARSPEKLDASRGAITIETGDVRNAEELARAMRGCEAVISALGPPLPPSAWPRPSTILGDAAGATCEAMKQAGVRRLVVVSGDLQFPTGGPPAPVRLLLLRHLDRDQAALERVVRASDLDWTIVRPTRLTMKPRADYRTEVDAMPVRPRAISRLDVADFLVGCAERGTHRRAIVGLAR
jgi:putative NADH-flavin reductase